MELEILEIIEKAIDEKKGEDIVTFDVSGRNPFYDHVVIATVNNIKLANAVIDEIEKNLHLVNHEINHIEGLNNDSKWVLIDCNGIIVHLFTKEERERVNLEDLLTKAIKR